MKNSRILLNILAMAFLALAGVASANEITKEGYLIDSLGNVVRNSYNECWRTGTWTPDMAIAECDPALVKRAGHKKPRLMSITLQADTLFDFNSAALSDKGKKSLDDEVVSKMKQSSQIESVQVTGHADRIGSRAYNQKLSQRRANAVKSYLVSQGIEGKRITTVAKGASQPLVSCDNVKGKANGKNQELVKCLQPNRRVVVEAMTPR
jgi:OOP family OmpA-OmpF porin